MAEHPLLKRIAEGQEYHGPEPLQLWFLPILLRSREQYNLDHLAAARRQIEHMWETQSSLFGSRQEFDQSGASDEIWERLSPAWWGVTDIVGFIDVRMHAQSIMATLFSTRQRASKVMKSKSYVFRRHVSIAISPLSSNEVIRPQLISAVEALAADGAIKRRYLDLSRWRPLVEATNITTLYNREYGARP